MKEVSRLYQALCHFKGAQGAIGDGKVDSLSKEFEDVAKAAFYTGYFLVNRGDEKYEYRIELTCLEFYYHEDAQDGIKDPRKLLKGKNTFYCEKGAVLPHNYGVDIIFDDDDEKFHASFLIRGFKSIRSLAIGMTIKKNGTLSIYGTIFLAVLICCEMVNSQSNGWIME